MSKLILKSNTGLKKKVQESIMDDGNEEYGSDALKRMLALAGVVSDDPASAAYTGDVIDTDAEVVDPELEDEDFTLSGENFHEGDIEDEDFDNGLEDDEDALIEYDPTDDIQDELIEDEGIDGSIDGVYDNEITDGELLDDATRFAIWRGWKECPDCSIETYAEQEEISPEELMSIIDEYSHPYEKDFTVGAARPGRSNWMDELDGKLRGISESHILDEDFDNGYLGESFDDDEDDDSRKCIENGDRVKVRGEGGEIFTVSQCDGRRCWIGDEDGAGWYIGTHRLEKVYGNDETIYEEKGAQAKERPTNSRYGSNVLAMPKKSEKESDEDEIVVIESEEDNSEFHYEGSVSAIPVGTKVKISIDGKWHKGVLVKHKMDDDVVDTFAPACVIKTKEWKDKFEYDDGYYDTITPLDGSIYEHEDEDEELEECADYDYRLASRFGRKYEIDFNNNSIHPDGAAERERPTNSRYGSNALWYPGRGKPSSNDG